jgi:hypothetical protein
MYQKGEPTGSRWQPLARSLNLPLFSRISLMRIMKAMRLMDVDGNVIFIADQAAAAQVLSRELGFGRTKSVGLGSSSGSSRCLPILERFASEGAERVAGNKIALNVERVMDDGVNG